MVQAQVNTHMDFGRFHRCCCGTDQPREEGKSGPARVNWARARKQLSKRKNRTDLLQSSVHACVRARAWAA